MFNSTISPQPLKLLQPDLVWWCTIMDPSVMQENRFAVFKFKVTVRAQIIKYMTVSDISIELLIFLHPNLVGWHIIISLRGVLFCCRCFVCVCECVEIRLLFSRSRSQGRIKTLLNLYVFYMFCTTDLLATKLAVLIYIVNNQTKYNNVGIYWQ